MACAGEVGGKGVVDMRPVLRLAACVAAAALTAYSTLSFSAPVVSHSTPPQAPAEVVVARLEAEGVEDVGGGGGDPPAGRLQVGVPGIAGVGLCPAPPCSVPCSVHPDSRMTDARLAVTRSGGSGGVEGFLSFAVGADVNGDVGVARCERRGAAAEIRVMLRPVSDAPVVAEVADFVRVSLSAAGSGGAVTVPAVLRGVSAGPATAVDEDGESLYSPLQCTVGGLGMEVFAATPEVQLRDMQNTVSFPTTGDLELRLSGKTGNSTLSCRLLDTAGREAELPLIGIEITP